MPKINKTQAAGFLFAGAMVGAVLALMYAPQSGARTTRNIKAFARKTVDRLDDLQGDIREKVADWVDDMNEVVQDGVERGKRLGAKSYEQVFGGIETK